MARNIMAARHRDAPSPDPRRPVKKRRTGKVLRKDIQGMRMVAVILVVTDHLFGFPAGGYVGVDVFFVISGFLITSLLLKEIEATGSLSLLGFMRRRIRRLLPLSTVVLVTTSVLAWTVFVDSRARSATIDAIWAALVSANWHFASDGTDYFQQLSPDSPIQHFWSLSVEEQFYLVWPIALLGMVLVAARLSRGWTVRKLALVALGVVFIGSLAYSIAETSAAPQVAYFSTLSRAWEIAVGGLIALSARFFLRIPSRMRPIIAYAGLAGIAWSALNFSATTAFPGPWALVPVLSTALIIVSGTGGQSRALYPLTNPVSQYIGDISYSVYLWQTPVIVFASTLFATTGRVFFATVLAVIGLLSVASYHLIEKPFRDRTWFPRSRMSNRRLSLTAAAVALSLVASGFAISQVPANDRDAAESATIDPDATPAAALEVVARGVSDAIASESWPPFVDNLEAAQSDVSYGLGGACFSEADVSADNCVTGPEDADKRAVVIGDSVAGSFLPGIADGLAVAGYGTSEIGNPSCPFIDADIEVPLIPDRAALCNDIRAKVIDYINATKPEIVILTDVETGIGALASHARGSAADEEWQQARVGIIEAIRPSGARVVILTPDPMAKNIGDCSPKVRSPRECILSIGDLWERKAAADAAAAAATGATYVDTSSWFCDAEGRCPVFANGLLMRWDDLHLTMGYAKFLAPVFRDAILATPPG